MSLDLTETYIDTVTGYLHVTLNELFKLKANYTVLENEFETLIKQRDVLQKEFGETHAQFADKSKKVDELTEFETQVKTLLSENEALVKKVAHINTFSKQLIENKSTIARLEQEITSYIEAVAALRIERDELQKLVPVEQPPITLANSVNKKKKSAVKEINV